jgi:uncharacterized protein YcbK (DUF882 family)
MTIYSQDRLDNPARRRLLQGVGASSLVLASGLGSAARSAQAPADTGPAPVLVEPLNRREALDWKQVLLAGERSLTLRRDGPTTKVRYVRSDGSLDVNGYVVACYLLRDVRADQTVQIDPHLLDVLCGIQRWMDFNGKPATIDITSGFRTLKTNDSAEGSGRHSMHLYGRAADITVPGAPSRLIGDMVQRFNNEGGTGIYLGRGFVHVDTGSARTWVAGPPRPTRALRRRTQR